MFQDCSDSCHLPVSLFQAATIRPPACWLQRRMGRIRSLHPCRGCTMRFRSWPMQILTVQCSKSAFGADFLPECATCHKPGDQQHDEDDNRQEEQNARYV